MTSGVSDRVTSTVVTDMVCMADMAETSMRQNISAAGFVALYGQLGSAVREVAMLTLSRLA